jgi:hypothetical protein
MIKKAYKPKIGSKRETIYKFVLANPGLSAIQVWRRTKLYDDQFMVTRELNMLVTFKALKEVNGLYYERIEEPEIVTEVLIRQPFVFKPLNNFLPKLSPRGQPIEHRSFKICKSSVKPTKNDL